MLWRILINYDEKRYLSQFVSEILDSLQCDSSTRAPQYECTRFVTMAIYCFHTSLILKALVAAFSVLLLFANCASSAWLNKNINMLGRACGLAYCFLSDTRILLKCWHFARCFCHSIMLKIMLAQCTKPYSLLHESNERVDHVCCLSLFYMTDKTYDDQKHTDSSNILAKASQAATALVKGDNLYAKSSLVC